MRKEVVLRNLSMDRRFKNIATTILALSLFSAQAAFAVPSNSTWTGATGNGLMSTAGNWSAAPTSDPGTILTFPGTLANNAFFTVKDGLGAAFQIGTLTITGNAADISPTYTISPNSVSDSLLFDGGGAGTITVTGGTGTNVQTNTLSIPITNNLTPLAIYSLNGLFTYSGALSGTGTVVYHGNATDTQTNHGAIILQGDNSGMTGGNIGFTDNAFVAFSSEVALGPNVIGQQLVFQEGTLLPMASGMTLNQTIKASSPGALINVNVGEIPSGTLTATNLAFFWDGVAFGVAGAGAATPGGTLTLSGASLITGIGTSVTLTGNPVLLLNTGTNTYDGPTTLTSGTLQAGGINVFSNASVVSLAAAPTAILDLNNFDNEIGGLSGGGASLGGTVNLGSGTLKLKGSAGTGYFGSIIGTGGVTLDAGPTGILQLGGMNTYSGTTTINQGTLQAGADNGFSPNSPVVIANHVSSFLDLFGYDNTIYSLAAVGPNGTVTLGGGTLTLDGSGTTAFNGAITQSGGLTLNGSGSLTLLMGGTNTYTGPTAILSGAIGASANALSTTSGITLANNANALLGVLGNNSIAYLAGGGNLGGNVSLNGGTLTLLGFTSAPYGGQFTLGIGGLTLNGSGTLQLTGTGSIYSGNTTITSGTLQAGATNTFSPNSLVTLANSASALLDLNNFNNTIRALSGGGASGGNVHLGSGTLTISGAFINTYSGAISGSGGLTINVPANAVILNAASGTNTYSGTTSVVAGNLIAGGANSLSPNSIVSLASGATLDITAAGNEIANLSGAAGAGVLLGNNTLRLINDTHNETYNGTITGVNGGLRVTLGSGGSTTLGGTNSYGGNTLVESGTLVIGSGGHTTTALAHTVGGVLEVNGTLTTPTTQIDIGSTLRGTGTIDGPSTVQVHGTTAPGNGIGTLTITGTYEQFSGSTFQNEISPTATDLLAVSGAVTIDAGATFSLFPEPGTYDPNHSYIVITGNPRTGTFSTLTSSTIFLTPILTYPTNQVVLNVIENPITVFATKGNPHKVAVALDTLLAEGSSIADSIFADIFFLSASEVIHALDQMHPAQLKAQTLIQESNALNVRNALTNHLSFPLFKQDCSILPKKEKNCACPEKKPFNAWIEGLGDWLRQSATHYASSHQVGYTDFMAGVVLGADYQFTDVFNAGLLGAYTHSNTHWLADQGHGTIESAYAGAYLSAIGESMYAMASVIGSWSDYHRDRNILFPGVNKTATSKTDGYQVVSSLEVGFLTHHVDWIGLSFSPFDLFDCIAQNEKGFREHEAGAYDLKVKKSDATMLRNELGVNIFRCECSHNVRWIFDAKISWVREMRLHAGHYTSSFAGTDVPFTVTGYMPDRNLVSPGASITALLYKKNLSVNAYYNGLYGNKFSDNSIGAGLTYNY